METRVASVGDVARVSGLSSGLFREDGGTRDAYVDLRWPEMEGESYFASVIRDPGSLCAVGEVSGRVVGYLVGRFGAGNSVRPVKVADLESMYVLPEFRGGGFGTALVREFMVWARDLGAERLSVTAYASNEAAIRFYRRHGFSPKSVTLERGTT